MLSLTVFSDLSPRLHTTEGLLKPIALKLTSIRLESCTNDTLKCYDMTSLVVVHNDMKKLEKFLFFVIETKQ